MEHGVHRIQEKYDRTKCVGSVFEDVLLGLISVLWFLAPNCLLFSVES